MSKPYENIQFISNLVNGRGGGRLCLQPQIYQPPVNAPVAKVGATLQTLYTRRSSTAVDFVVNDTRHELFHLRYTQLTKENMLKTTLEPVNIQANTPITFLYEQHFINEVCRISLNAVLEPNKSYTVIDDLSYGDGLFGTKFLSARRCHFGIIDNQTQQLIGTYR